MSMVSVIVLHHLNENQPYLDMALNGLACQETEFETIVIASSDKAPKVPEHVKLIHDKKLNSACKKYNIGPSLCNPKSDLFVFHSDDVVMSKDCLPHLVGLGRVTKVIQSPLSNSDVGSRFWLNVNLRPDMELDDAALHDIAQVSGRHAGLVIRQDWISFFCPVIPKDVWKEVGPMDERLESRYCDVDYCKRAGQLGIASVINAGAFAFHYGSKTLSKITRPEDYQACDKEWLAKNRST